MIGISPSLYPCEVAEPEFDPVVVVIPTAWPVDLATPSLTSTLSLRPTVWVSPSPSVSEVNRPCDFEVLSLVVLAHDVPCVSALPHPSVSLLDCPLELPVEEL